jgi:Ca2+ transporting ATPase
LNEKVEAHDIIRKKDDKIVTLVPFSSSRKRATTALSHPDNSKLIRVFCKGAPEIVLQFCSK